MNRIPLVHHLSVQGFTSRETSKASFRMVVIEFPPRTCGSSRSTATTFPTFGSTMVSLSAFTSRDEHPEPTATLIVRRSRSCLDMTWTIVKRCHA